MKFFNSQNCQRRKYKTVWLNFDNRRCDSVSFWVDNNVNSIQVTARDFAKAKTRCLNFAYASGINQANYQESVSRQGNLYTFTYSLNKVTVDHEIFGINTLYDYAKAIFKDGVPVDTFSITIDVSTGAVTNTNFLTAVDKGYSAFLDAESTTDDTTDPAVIYPPVIKLPGGTSKAMTYRLAINMQTRLNPEDVPGYAVRHNMDDVGGSTNITVVAWFIQFKADYIKVYVVYDGADHSFEFMAEDPRPYRYTAYIWYSDEPTEGTENTFTSYQDTIATYD